MKPTFFEIMNKKLTTEQMKEAEQYNQRELDSSLSTEKELTGTDLIKTLKKNTEQHENNKVDSKNTQSTLKNTINSLDSIDELEEIIEIANERLANLKLNQATNVSVNTF